MRADLAARGHFATAFIADFLALSGVFAFFFVAVIFLV